MLIKIFELINQFVLIALIVLVAELSKKKRKRDECDDMYIDLLFPLSGGSLKYRELISIGV